MLLSGGSRGRAMQNKLRSRLARGIEHWQAPPIQLDRSNQLGQNICAWFKVEECRPSGWLSLRALFKVLSGEKRCVSLCFILVFCNERGWISHRDSQARRADILAATRVSRG